MDIRFAASSLRGSLRRWALLCAGCILTVALARAQSDDKPSFSCAHVTSRVNQLICATPQLARLDAELAQVFENMRGQPIDQQKLRADEDAWLARLRRDCSDAACIQSHYEERLSELREQSLRAASPAAYDETRPFPAPPALWAEARARIGTHCTYETGVVGPVIPGFSSAARFLPVTLAAGLTVVREKGGVRFAFLISPPTHHGACEILDAVVLPSTAVGDRFLQCSADDPQLTGFGIRNAKTHELDGFWTVNSEQRKFERVPMGVLGIEKAVRCQQPETPE